ncbi:MAG: hypothetical protein M3R59_07220 [Verrucomicrobiota bacterium]|nr:hypothetical protein [Verrucomicrobiota bacterium]
MKFSSFQSCALKVAAIWLGLVCVVPLASAQIQVQLKFHRLQYISYEPLMATVSITNRAGRDIDLRDDAGQHWYGFEITSGDGESLGPTPREELPPLHIASGNTVTQKINLTSLFPIQDLGTYHIRANVYFADLGKFYYSQTKVVQVVNARPIWKQTVGAPAGGDGETRTFSLLSNRFPDHTSLYVRVENENSGVVYATYSLGRVIAFDEPHAEFDRQNQLHVLHCSAPRVWSYAVIGLNGQMISHTMLLETKTRPHFRREPDGDLAVVGGMAEDAAVQTTKKNLPKLSARPPEAD